MSIFGESFTILCKTVCVGSNGCIHRFTDKTHILIFLLTIIFFSFISFIDRDNIAHAGDGRKPFDEIQIHGRNHIDQVGPKYELNIMYNVHEYMRERDIC